MISSGGLTARLDRLEGAGLIRRRAAGDDARSVIVELTRDGRKKIEGAFRADMEIENRMVSGLSENERAELVRLLRKLTRGMRGVERSTLLRPFQRNTECQSFCATLQRTSQKRFNNSLAIFFFQSRDVGSFDVLTVCALNIRGDRLATFSPRRFG
jgi:hypothetical protein